MKHKIQLILYCLWGSFFLFVGSPVYAQNNQTLTGRVVDQFSSGLEGISVAVKGTTTSTVTGESGNFSLLVPARGATLVFSSVGYRILEVSYQGQESLTVSLEADNTSLDEVVVIGYGTQRKRDLTGSVASVKAEDLARQGPRINFMQSLQGAAPGLNVTQTGNSANSGSISASIRGQNSIAASNAPLVILDGVPYSGGLNYIDQSTIESVEVLKDASSAAIYGARGANGVIIITTKQGKSGKPIINYEGSYGWKQVYRIPDLLTGPEHWDFGVERYGEAAISQNYPTRVANYQNGNFTDWVKEATQVGGQQKHAVTLSGGTEHVRYLVSGNFADVNGISKGDQFQQVTGRANLSVKPVHWLEVGTNTQYTFADNSGVEVAFLSGGDAPHTEFSSGGAFLMNPLISPYDENGKYLLRPWPEMGIYPNPFSTLNILDGDYNRRLFSNNFITVTLPLDGLSYKLNTGYTNLSSNRDIFWGANTVEGSINDGQAYTSDGKQTDWLIENLLFYNQRFGDHRFDFTFLYSAQAQKHNNITLLSRGFPTEALTWFQPGSGSVVIPGRTYVQESYLSQMGRLFYSFKDRYLVTATVRRDGFSAFGDKRKFGVFPSIALAWNADQESLFQRVNGLEVLRLRLSYGANGNQAISPFSTLAKVSRGDYLVGPTGNQQGVGYRPSSLENPILGWETTRSFNAGIDYGFWNGRLFGAVDFYNANTVDLLLNRNISPINGLTSIVANIGKVRNMGVEVTLSSPIIKKPDLEWFATANIAHNRNQIVDLYGNGLDDITNGWFIGKPISVNYGYLFGGVWQQTDDISNSHQPAAKPGDLKIVDVNRDGEITPDDRTFIGQRSPKVNFGFSNRFRLKQFTLNIMVTGRVGATKTNPLWETDVVHRDAIRNTLKQNWWREDNPTNDYPANRDGTNPLSVKFYKSANLVRVNNVSLTYDLPASLCNDWRLSGLSISAGLINGLTFTPWNGLDPEYSEQRSTPFDRVYNVGINLAF